MFTVAYKYIFVIFTFLFEVVKLLKNKVLLLGDVVKIFFQAYHQNPTGGPVSGRQSILFVNVKSTSIPLCSAMQETRTQ